MRCVTTLASILVLLLFVVGCGDGGSSAPAVTSAASGPGAPPPSGYGGSGSSGYGNTGYGNNGYENSGYGDTNPTASTGDDGGSDDGYATQASSGTNDGYGETSADGGNPVASTADDGGTAGPYASAAEARGAYQDGYGQPAGISFQQQIQPIFQARCYGCHGPGPQANKGELRLHMPGAIEAAGVVLAGRPEQSELVYRITAMPGSEDIMPPRGAPLGSEEIELIRTWIQQGARFGDDAYAAYSGSSGASADGYSSADGVEQVQQPEPPKTFDGQATLAFHEGRDRDAMLFLFAHALADSDNGAAVLEKYRWARGLKHAVLAIRWGLGVEYSAKGRFEGDPMPIGREQDRPDGREGREGSGTRVSDPYGTRSGRGTTGAAGVEQDSPDPAEALDYYTGEVGALVVEQLQSRIARGYFGDMLKDVAELGTSGQEDVGDSQFGDATGDYDAYGQGPARGLRGRENVDGYEQDRLGNANDGDAAADPIHQVVAGVTMLGLGSRHELFQKARQQDVDALLIFVVDVERNARNGMVYNNTKLRLFDVAQDKQLAGTRLMNNYKIQVAREKDEDDETVKLEVENVFKVADEHFRCIEVPGQIQPSHAAGHASKLAARTYENPLRVLAEIRYWHSRKLVSDDQLLTSFTGIVGAEGATKLAQGSADERKAVLEQWLPGAESERTTRTPTGAEVSVR